MVATGVVMGGFFREIAFPANHGSGPHHRRAADAQLTRYDAVNLRIGLRINARETQLRGAD